MQHDTALYWDAGLAQTTVHLIAGALWGPEEASKFGYTSDEVISHVRALVDLRDSVEAGIMNTEGIVY